MLLLKRSTSSKTGYLNVIERKSVKHGIVYHAKLCCDPDSKDQTTLPGEGLLTAQQAAIRLAVFKLQQPLQETSQRMAGQQVNCMYYSAQRANATLAACEARTS